MIAGRLDRISINVARLAEAGTFYTDALGFRPVSVAEADPALASLLGARALRVMRLRRGRQVLELTACDPAGAPYPAERHSNDAWFQHCALVTDDIAAAVARLGGHGAVPISRNGPQTLPNGIIAYKFRDPEGHPLELIQFVAPDPQTRDGIDHSAIVVSDIARAIAFYGHRLGLALRSREVNIGPAQADLDGLDAPVVDVVGMAPPASGSLAVGALAVGAPSSGPHVELLGYRAPRGRAGAAMGAADIAATRLVFSVDALGDAEARSAVTLADDTRVALIHDPDGHAVLVEQSRRGEMS